MLYCILIGKKIFKIFFFILIFRFFFLKQIKKCNNISPIPNLINFFVFKFSNWLIIPFDFIINKIYEKKEWINVILVILLLEIFIICFYGRNIEFNLFNIIIITALYLFEYYLITILIFILIEFLLTIFQFSSNLNYFFYSLNLRIFKRLKIIRINKFILGFNINLIFYFSLIATFLYFYRILIRAYVDIYK